MIKLATGLALFALAALLFHSFIKPVPYFDKLKWAALAAFGLLVLVVTFGKVKLPAKKTKPKTTKAKTYDDSEDLRLDKSANDSDLDDLVSDRDLDDISDSNARLRAELDKLQQGERDR